MFETPTGPRLLVSHGVDEATLRNVVLPSEPPASFPGASFDAALGEWVIAGDPDKAAQSNPNTRVRYLPSQAPAAPASASKASSPAPRRLRLF